MAERLQPDNGIIASDIPDSVKTLEWWKLQNDISTAQKKGDGPREIRLLNKQRRLERELLTKANKLKKEGKL